MAKENVVKPGIVFLEIDGLGGKVLKDAMNMGKTPNMKRWADCGSHKLIVWDSDLPSQTSAAQAGILHGNNFSIPAFRWYDKEKRNIVVSSSIKDVSQLEKQISDGKGLLCNGGTVRASLLSGDASRVLMTTTTTTGSLVTTTISSPETTTTGAAAASFKNDVQPIFNNNCVVCHQGTGQAGLVLTPNVSYSNLVGVSSTESPKELRVKAGSANQSYLIAKLDGTQVQAGGSGSQMPYGATPLPQSQINLISQWISEGAPNN